jgi:hypothetical protein
MCASSRAPARSAAPHPSSDPAPRGTGQGPTAPQTSPTSRPRRRRIARPRFLWSRERRSNPARGTGQKHKFERFDNLDTTWPRACDLRRRGSVPDPAPDPRPAAGPQPPKAPAHRQTVTTAARPLPRARAVALSPYPQLRSGSPAAPAPPGRGCPARPIAPGCHLAGLSHPVISALRILYPPDPPFGAAVACRLFLGCARRSGRAGLIVTWGRGGDGLLGRPSS